MNYSKISVRYAKALFSLALDNNTIDKTKSDIDYLYSICKESKAFIEIIENPIIKPALKINIYKKLFTNNLSKQTLSFLELVTINKREQYLKIILLNFINLYRNHKGIKEVTLTSAIKISDTVNKELIDKLSSDLNSQIELTNNINEDIIGGFILRVEDMQIDASISNKLEKVKRELLNKTYEKNI